MAATEVVHIAPTLATMASIYKLSREGGPRSERFSAYRKRVEHEWGLVAYNPMAGEAALRAVERLIELDAESITWAAAAAAVSRCEYSHPVTLAVAVLSKGMWTDRVATEIEHRTAQPTAQVGKGCVTLWTGEPVDESIIRREAVATTVRVMMASLHGARPKVVEVLWREGLAYALAVDMVPLSDTEIASLRPDDLLAPASDADAAAVTTAIEVLGDSDSISDVASVLMGDAVAEAMGWPPLGIEARSGYRWAIRHASRVLALSGAPASLRAHPPVPTTLTAAP